MRTLATMTSLLALTMICCVDGADPIETSVACGDRHCAPIEEGICTEDCVICGDMFCDDRETDSCPADCDVCGDGVCTEHEFAYGCVSDCFQCINLIWGVTVNCMPENCGMQEDVICAHCGDGECEPFEERNGCPDCVEDTCGDGECLLYEWGICEDCADDVCGDRFCGCWEEEFGLCPEDCAVCGDGECEPVEYHFCNMDCRPAG